MAYINPKSNDNNKNTRRKNVLRKFMRFRAIFGLCQP